MYDAALAESLKRQPKASTADGGGDCCPPPKKKAASGEPAAPIATTAATTGMTGMTGMRGTAAAGPGPRNRGSQDGKQKQAQQASARSGGAAATGAGKHGAQRTPEQAQRKDGHGSYDRRDGNGDYDTYGGYGRSRNARRANRYQEPVPTFGRRFAIGMTATMASIVGLLLAVYLSTLNSGSSAQAAGYLNQSPAGAVYHVPNAVPDAAQLESQAVVATVGADGVQTANLVLDQATSSYKPAAIKVKRGAPVRLNVTVNGSSRDCRSVVRLPALGVQALTQPGQVVPMSFTPSQTGVFQFNCPMQMMNPSYLVVTD
jgi:hypothetical protein